MLFNIKRGHSKNDCRKTAYQIKKWFWMESKEKVIHLSSFYSKLKYYSFQGAIYI